MKTSNIYEKKGRGFSLLELIVALSIFSLTSLFSLSAFNTSFRLLQVRKDIAKITDSLALALEVAKLEKQKIDIATDENTLYLRRENEELPLFQVPLKSTLRFQEMYELSVYESGTTTPHTIWLQNDKEKCKIVISLRGRIRSECSSL